MNEKPQIKDSSGYALDLWFKIRVIPYKICCQPHIEVIYIIIAVPFKLLRQRFLHLCTLVLGKAL